MLNEPSAPAASASFLEIRERIVARYPQLSPQLKTIAQFALANPDRMGVETVAQLAARLDAPASSIVRFAQAMGYSGFLEMKRGFSAHLMYRAQALDAPPAAAEGPAWQIAQAVAEARRSLGSLEHEFDVEGFNRAAEALSAARDVFVAAQHLSFPLASLFAWRLIEAGRQCVLLDNVGGFALRQSQLAGSDDATLAISFCPYQPSVVEEAKAHQERGGAVVAITDTPLSPLAPHADELLIVAGARSGGAGALAGALVMVGALAEAVAERSRRKRPPKSKRRGPKAGGSNGQG